MGNNPSFDRKAAAFTSLLVVVGLYCRYLAAQGELALDEIWSLTLLQDISSPLEVFTKIHHDNNHYLNSLYLLFVGADASPLEYRAFSLGFSVLALVVVAWLGWRRSVSEGMVLAILFSSSYPLILFSSEARGYSAMVFFALVSFALAREALAVSRPLMLICFWLAGIGGFLAHSTFLTAFGPLAVWSALALRRAQPGRALHAWLWLYAVPLFAISIFSMLLMRGIVLGGGPQVSHAEIGINTIAVAFGLPELSPAAIPVSAMVTVAVFIIFSLLCLALIMEWRAKEPDALFFLLAVLALPLAVVTVVNPPVLFVRYFLCAIVFSYFLTARLVVRMANASAFGRMLLVTLLLCFVIGHARLARVLIVDGRGHFADALNLMRQTSKESSVFFGGDPDARNELLASYFIPRMTAGKPLVYVPQQYPEPLSVPFVLLQSQDSWFIPEPYIAAQDGARLTLIESYRSAPLSGIRLSVYRR